MRVRACAQVRIHRTHASDLYLRTRSRPIVEHCTGLRFAPYPQPLVASAQLHELLAAHRLAEETGTWEQVRETRGSAAGSACLLHPLWPGGAADAPTSAMAVPTYHMRAGCSQPPLRLQPLQRAAQGIALCATPLL